MWYKGMLQTAGVSRSRRLRGILLPICSSTGPDLICLKTVMASWWEAPCNGLLFTAKISSPIQAKRKLHHWNHLIDNYTFFKGTTIRCLAIRKNSFNIDADASLGGIPTPHDTETQRFKTRPFLKRHLSNCKRASASSRQRAKFAFFLLVFLFLLQFLQPILIKRL